MQRFQFYLEHSLNDLKVNGQRSVFSILCVAAGVAAIVSLQTLGVMIENALSQNLQASNRGDIRLTPYNDADRAAQVAREQARQEGLVNDDSDFTLKGIQSLRDFLTRRYPDDFDDLTYRVSVINEGPAAVSIPSRDTFESITRPLFIEPARYPLYGDIEDEAGRPLRDLIETPTDVVISQNLAEKLAARVGDSMQVGGANELFTIRGIVDTRAEGGLDNLVGTLSGYWFADVEALRFFGPASPAGDYPPLAEVDVQSSAVFVRLRDTRRMAKISAALQAQYPFITARTTDDLREENADLSDLM